MNRENQISPDQEELNWLAFCYIAEELDEPARTNFENRLEHDQAAREAVANAMAQAQFIWEACDQSSASPRTKFNPQPVAHNNKLGLFVGIAAALALMVGGFMWMANSDNGVNSITDAQDQESQVALAFGEVIAEDNDAANEFVSEPYYQEVNFVDSDEEDDWLYVALTDLEDSYEGVE